MPWRKAAIFLKCHQLIRGFIGYNPLVALPQNAEVVLDVLWEKYYYLQSPM
jgi:hypothetical protein